MPCGVAFAVDEQRVGVVFVLRRVRARVGVCGRCEGERAAISIR